MLDDEHDKQMMRNQMRAIILLFALMMGYYFWFVPQQPPAEQPPAQEGQTIAGAPESGGEPTAPVPGESPGPMDAGSPLLPPAAGEELADDLVTISDQDLVLTFTKIGGRLKEAVVRLGKEGQNSIQLVPASGAEGIYPFGLNFSDERIGEGLNTRRFDAEVDPSGKEVTFSIELPGEAIVRKHFSLSDTPHVLDVQVDYQSLRTDPAVLGMDATPAYTLSWGPGVQTGDVDRTFAPTLIWRRGDTNETMAVEDLVTEGEQRVPLAEWFGYKSKYFLVALRPQFERGSGVATVQDGTLQFGLSAPRFEVAPGQRQSHAFETYIGPLELASLEKAWDTLPTALTFFTMFELMDWFAKLLLSVLHWFYENTIANYGVAIIFLTLLVRLVMLPLTLKSMRSMKKMQSLAPEMEALREKYKDDQQELSRATLTMYRERGVNPLGGCFPMLLQMPIFIALYRMLWNAFELRGAPFLWVEDLSRPDCLVHLPFMAAVPFLGQYVECLNLLPILMGAAMVLNMKIMPMTGVQNPQQKMVMTLMPIIFSVFCYPLAAGLNLYVLTSTILGMVQQGLVRASGPGEKPEIVKRDRPRKRARNVWARAQEMKRQHKKEERRRQSQEFREQRQKKGPAGAAPRGSGNGASGEKTNTGEIKAGKKKRKGK